MTLDLLIVQVLMMWNLRNIGVPVLPPGETLVHTISQKTLRFSTEKSKKILRASGNSHLLKPYYMYNLRKILRATSPPRRDSRSFDFASSLDGVQENRRVSSPPRIDSRLYNFAETPI